jgi:hypothetical protein
MIRLYLALVLCACSLNAQTADEIMAKVAKNQDADVAARSQFVYHQNILMRMKRANGKLAREETRDYTVTPSEKGLERKLIRVAGSIGDGKKAVTYDSADFRHSNLDIDGEIIQGIADDFGHDQKSKDGVDHDLFPLRSDMLSRYVFKLSGTEKWHDRDVYHITFKGLDKDDDDHHCWAGEALIDKTEFQPLMVTSYLDCKIPVLVKTLLGTNVKQVGFKVTYQKFDEGIWFPVTYGGEFQFRAAFVYARTVGIGLVNSDFHHTQVDTAIKYEMP